MRNLIVAAHVGLVLAGFSGASMAACTGGGRVMLATNLTALLQGNTACVPAVTVSRMKAQELHVAGGDVVDYKRGPGPGPTGDPSKKVGTWSVTGNVGGADAVVTYNYGSGQVYTYSVFANGDGTHSFCSANPEVIVRVQTGGGPCVGP